MLRFRRFLTLLAAASPAWAAEPSATDAKPPSVSASTTVPAPPESAPRPAAKAKGDDSQARRIATHDILSIRVADEPELTIEQMRVDDDGTISYPFLGSIKVSGMTRGEVEKLIHDKLEPDWIINPQVSVDFKTYDIQYVTVSGPVGHAGQVQIPPDHRMDIVEAIGAAGDFLRNADQNDIKVRNTKTGQTRSYRYRDLIKAGAPPVFVESGETIIIGTTIL